MMVNVIRFIIFFIFLTPLGFSQAWADSEMSVDGPELLVNNRILARVGSKSISVLDVMKKMDVVLARAYPEYAKNPMARYQFFSANWRQTLNQIIDQELIMADAEKIELKISDSEIRETLHERFGPNLMPTLDKLGISLDEAWRMIYAEIAVGRMSGYRVNLKALQRIGPNEIKAAYKTYVKEHPPVERWKYRVVSVRSKNSDIASTIAQKAYSLLQNQKIPFEQLTAQLDEKEASVQLSEEYDLASKDLSEDHKKVLASLLPGCFSVPIAQVSRRDQSIVQRIFYLKDHLVEQAPTFDKLSDKLHEDLVQAEIDRELPDYLKRLRQRFNFDEKALDNLPKDFQPFILTNAPL